MRGRKREREREVFIEILTDWRCVIVMRVCVLYDVMSGRQDGRKKRKGKSTAWALLFWISSVSSRLNLQPNEGPRVRQQSCSFSWFCSFGISESLLRGKKLS